MLEITACRGMRMNPISCFPGLMLLLALWGGEQAAKTMRHVAEVAAERRGEEFDEKKLASQEAAIKEIFSKQQSAFYTSARNLDHGVIDPRDTRKVLGFALETCIEGRVRELKANTFGIARA